jgi:hypothetical protein
MNEREFFIALPDGTTIRVRLYKERGRILSFVAQLEAYLDNDWTPISRYDTAHGFVHRDDLRPDGAQIKSPPMAFRDNEEALNYAVTDLRSNSQFYLERYLQWQRQLRNK